MTAETPIAVLPVAASPVSSALPYDGKFFDVAQTVLSQYANSPVLRQLIAFLSDWFDPGERFDSFYHQIWNIDTAVGFGLDVWGRILGVGRVLQVPSGDYIGFQQQPESKVFGEGILWRGVGGSNNAVLADDAYRKLLMAKAALNITDASIPSINRILMILFGDGYVRDNLDMTITYVFSMPLDPVSSAIILQSGVLPRPCGVTAGVETV